MEFVPISIAASFTDQQGIKKSPPAGAFSTLQRLRPCAIRARLALAPRVSMNGSVTISARSPDFQRAFVAMRYFWGMRGPALADALDGVGVQAATADVLTGLCHAERTERAKAL